MSVDPLFLFCFSLYIYIFIYFVYFGAFPATFGEHPVEDSGRWQLVEREGGPGFLEDQLHEMRGGAADRGHGVSWDGDQLSRE